MSDVLLWIWLKLIGTVREVTPIKEVLDYAYSLLPNPAAHVGYTDPITIKDPLNYTYRFDFAVKSIPRKDKKGSDDAWVA